MPNDPPFGFMGGAPGSQGGGMPSLGHAAMNERISRDTLETLKWAYHSGQQQELIRRRMLDSRFGGAAASDRFLYDTAGGRMALMAMHAAMSRFGHALGGSPGDLMSGIMQGVGASGLSFNNMIAPAGGGMWAPFGGRGAVTGVVSRQLFRGLEQEFYGKGGTDNFVSGLDRSQAGQLISALGRQGAFAGLAGGKVATMRAANLQERARHYVDNVATGSVRDTLRENLGRITEDSIDGLIKQMQEDGKAAVVDALQKLKKSRYVTNLDPNFKKQMADMVKGAAKLATELGEVFGSTDMNAMLEKAVAVTGFRARSPEQASMALRQVRQLRDFASAYGLSGQETMNAVATLGGATAMEMGGRNYAALGAQTAQFVYKQAVQSWLSQAQHQAGDRGGGVFSVQETSALGAAGVSARMKENPELMAAMDLLQSEHGLDPKTRQSLNRQLERFKHARTKAEMRDVTNRINRIFRQDRGVSAIEYMNRGRGGMDNVAKNLEGTEAGERLTEILGAQVQTTLREAGLKRTMISYGGRVKGLGGTGAQQSKLFGTLFGSLSETTQGRIEKAIRAGDMGGVRKILEEKQSLLVNTAGESVDVDTVMRGVTRVFGGGGEKAAELYGDVGHKYRTSSAEQRAGVSEEERATMRDRMWQERLSEGLDTERLPAGTFMGNLLKGFLMGDKGKITQAGYAFLAKRHKLGVEVAVDSKGFKNLTKEQLEKLVPKERMKEMLRYTGAGSEEELLKQIAAGDEGASTAFRRWMSDKSGMTMLMDKQTGKARFLSQAQMRTLRSHAEPTSKKAYVAGLLFNDIKDPKEREEARKQFVGSLTDQDVMNPDELAKKIHPGMSPYGAADKGLIKGAAKGDAASVHALRALDEATGGAYGHRLGQIIKEKEKELGTANPAQQEQIRKTIENLQNALNSITNPDEQQAIMHVLNMEVTHFHPGKKEK